MLKNFSRSTGRPGFTVIELLVVIGLILLLIGILVPVVSKVRRAGYVADTQQELSQLSTAIQSYYSDFHSYPGPFSNDQIEGTAAGFKMEIYTQPAGPNTTFYSTNWNVWNGTQFTSTNNVTGSENLVLGLLGGLRINPDGNPAFAPQEVGLGPLSLNTANPRRYSPFISMSYLVWCVANTHPVQTQLAPTDQAVLLNATAGNPGPLTNFTDQTDVTHANDSPIPEFVDRFPNPMPILYLRARSGAKGVISDGVIPDAGTGAIAHYQYDIREIAGYTNTGIGLAAGKVHDLIAKPASTGGGFNFVYQNSNSPPPNLLFDPARAGDLGPRNPPTGPTYNPLAPIPDAGAYFINHTITPSDMSGDAGCNYTGRPRSADQFILISAGLDGIYGTADDITSFGDVVP